MALRVHLLELGGPSALRIEPDVRLSDCHPALDYLVAWIVATVAVEDLGIEMYTSRGSLLQPIHDADRQTDVNVELAMLSQ